MASCVSRSHRPVRSAGCLALRLLRPHQAPGSRLVRVGGSPRSISIRLSSTSDRPASTGST